MGGVGDRSAYLWPLIRSAPGQFLLWRMDGDWHQCARIHTWPSLLQRQAVYNIKQRGSPQLHYPSKPLGCWHLTWEKAASVSPLIPLFGWLFFCLLPSRFKTNLCIQSRALVGLYHFRWDRFVTSPSGLLPVCGFAKIEWFSPIFLCSNFNSLVFFKKKN